MSTDWINDAIFYHIYPLGLCGAPYHNHFTAAPVPRLEKIYGWIDHLRYLGVNALYLGPLFESSTHGYNTVDYYHVDRRLGTDETLTHLVSELHRSGIRVILDGVFNHVGRDFWAFKDVQARLEQSPFRDWFAGMRFDQKSPKGDPFTYEGWNGHYSLVKLNLHNTAVREHLLGAVQSWIEQFDIDGLRLDAADVVDHDFLRELSTFSKRLKPDFWLMGEVVHGDYRQWVHPGELDSVTNYECYKGLYSSFNDRNFFEIAYALNRQFGEGGVYRSLPLYNFVDNHDVNRIASTLKDPRHLAALHLLLFTMPGVPSIYYGSEFGVPGVKDSGDHHLRPALDLHQLIVRGPQRALPTTIQRLSELRSASEALRRGDYRQMHVGPDLLAFSRQTPGDWVLVVINAADKPQELSLSIPSAAGRTLVDILNNNQPVEIHHDLVRLAAPACWGQVIRMR